MQNTTHKNQLVLVISLVLIVVGFAVFILFFNKANGNRYGEELTIANLGEYTKGHPRDKRSLEYIEHELFKTVNLNVSSPVTDNSIEDVRVRAGSFTQTLGDSTKVYTVSFIVDIQSLKQSYDVSYQWDASDSGNTEKLDEWGTVVKCLPKEKLLYGDFSCKDMFTELQGDTDSILNNLPHSTLDYNLTVAQGTPGVENQKLALDAELLLSAADVRSGRDAAIAAYTQEVRDYITSLGLNPDSYTINYTISESSPY